MWAIRPKLRELLSIGENRARARTEFRVLLQNPRTLEPCPEGETRAASNFAIAILTLLLSMNPCLTVLLSVRRRHPLEFKQDHRDKSK